MTPDQEKQLVHLQEEFWVAASSYAQWPLAAFARPTKYLPAGTLAKQAQHDRDAPKLDVEELSNMSECQTVVREVDQAHPQAHSPYTSYAQRVQIVGIRIRCLVEEHVILTESTDRQQSPRSLRDQM